MFNRFRSMPATAMAAVLGCALMATAAPAVAKQKSKDEEAEKGKGLSPSKGFSPALKKLSDATAAKDTAALQAAITEAQGLASKPDDQYLLAFYQLQLGIMTKDQAVQRQALEAMLDSGMTPPENLATYNFYAGNFAYGAKDYPKAIQRLEAAKAAGSTQEAVPVLLMDSYLKAGQIDQGWAIAKAAIEAARAAGKTPSEEFYVRPAQAFQKAKRPNETLDVLTMRVRDYGTPATWRNTLYILLQQSGGDKDLNLDILRLMRATDAMSKRPEFVEYTTLAADAGFPSEVVAVIAEGQAAGVIPPSGDPHFGPLAAAQGPRAKSDLAAITADADKPATLANPKTARTTADALVGADKPALAIPLYQAALTGSGGNDPLITYRLGVAQAMAGQNEAAIATFTKVQGKRQRLAELWTIHVKAKAAPAAASTPAPAADAATTPATPPTDD